MNFSFFRPRSTQLDIAQADQQAQLDIAQPGSRSPLILPSPASSHVELSRPASTDFSFIERTWCLPTQAHYLNDPWHLRIWEKSRQVGATKTDALDSVLKVSPAEARFDVWVTSRDELQARLYLEDCFDWAKILHLAATDLGTIVLDSKNHFTAHVLQFANGRRIYCLSSNPNALAGKRGHVKLDEFALHEDQELLFRVAKPVTTWGGTLSILSTHRGTDTLFNQFITDIRHRGNPMGWHLFSYPIQKAVDEGIVERINEKSGRNETREQYLTRTRAECGSIETWQQEYCCTPSDENTVFFTYEMLRACTDPTLKLMPLDDFLKYAKSPIDSGSQSGAQRTFFAGVDIARTKNLFVLDVGEKLGNVIHDRLRIELENRPFSEMEDALYPILALPQVKRCAIDAGGNGTQLHERARERFGYKADGVKFTQQSKEDMAFRLRTDFEDRSLRIPADEKLIADLRALKKQNTKSGDIRLEGQFENSHCDRTWAKALRQHAARYRPRCGGGVA